MTLLIRERASLNERACACRAERDAAVWPLGNRWTHHTPSWLRHEPAHPQKDRGSVRLDEDNRRHATTDAARYRADWMGLHLRCRRIQSRETAKAARITIIDLAPQTIDDVEHHDKEAAVAGRESTLTRNIAQSI